jgi:hypothetical protein
VGALTKGVSFTNLRAFVHGRWGKPGWLALMDRLTPQERSEIEAIVPVGWYPLELYARMIHELDDLHGAGDLGLIVQLGRFEAEHDITLIYRAMFRLMNPATVIVKTGEYWRKFHDTGRWEMKRISDKEIEGTLHDWGVVDYALCRELVGYMARALELVGADSVIFEHPECRAKGHNRCHFRARWGKTKQNTLDKPAKM